jgi:BolA protein
MSTQDTIYAKLEQELTPLHLEVIDESHMHNVPAGSESHFKVVVVSERFEGEKLLARHRMVNRTLSAELQGGVHALALHTMTPEEWFAKGGDVPASPECMGGSKAG